MTLAQTYTIAADTDFAGAAEARDKLAAWCRAKLKTRRLEISEGPCSQIALQLAFSAIDQMTKNDTPHKLGDRVAELHARRLPAPN